MIAVQYPKADFRVKNEAGRRFIFDKIRKTWLLLTEEEWVRQNFVNYLQSVLNYPAAFIALEKEIRLNELKKRFDILVYDKAHHPWMLVECKEPKVQLQEEVLHQVLRYNISVPVQYIVITNGEHTIAWQKEGGALMILDVLPVW
ncbi:MAG TPA: type I restriction enzyme HsdR N-terminal domain-containing protein [Flavisolibacter sp.]|nr:type I restriction enzyme HsdR N-terminal domain-containing protein [Flavisolibacter sp.]